MQNKNLTATYFLDFDHEIIQNFVTDNTSTHHSKEQKAIELYYAIRDLLRYDPYTYRLEKESFIASNVIKSGRNWCVPKAIAYAACCRAINVPTLLGFADVRNHLSTERMRKQMKTDIFHWHGYVSVFLHGKWVKVTPAFNIELCEKFGLKPLEFDGKNDSLYHPFDIQGNQHMEYLLDRGTFEEFPHKLMVMDIQRLYSRIESNEDANFDEDVNQEVEMMKKK